jgi:hypothetical protein
VGEKPDEGEPMAAQRLPGLLSDRRRKAGSLISHLPAQALSVKDEVNFDRAVTMPQRIGHQLADDHKDVLQHVWGQHLVKALSDCMACVAGSPRFAHERQRQTEVEP